MDRPTLTTLPRGPGTAVFTGGGWLGVGAGSQRRADEVLVLSDPCRVLAAHAADEVPALLDEIGAEQGRGRYVAGYVTYEAGAAFGLTVKPPDSLPVSGIPLAWMAVYPEASARYLSESERSSLFGALDSARMARLLAETEPKLSVTRPEFTQAIHRIRELIAAGDTYQVNYTVRARFDLDVDPFEYFLAMIVRQPVPFAAFLDLGDTGGHGSAQILSLSPELFLRRRSRLVESMPMKGTRPRGDTPEDDAALGEELIRSEKDRAENLMIVDMVRNDLGRVSRAGSIHVPALYSVEPYRTVWQMTSTVTGTVRTDATVGEIMAATFPGASITGAPKHHTMEIISELETEPRGVYTGTVGLFLPGGDFTGNLAIRTLVHEQGSFRLGVGGGIVWDSEAGDEYAEAVTKSRFALPRAGSRWEPVPPMERVRAAGIGLFETMLLEAEAPAARPESDTPEQRAGLSRHRCLAEHLDRMGASAAELGLTFDRAAAEQVLSDVATATAEPLVVRLELGADGTYRLTTRPVPARAPAPIALMVSPFRTDPYDSLLTHKTTARHLYDQERERAGACDCQEALFLNYFGRVTEGAITNIFARFGDAWFTPPVADGLLPGIWRADFLQTTGATERSLTLDDLLLADEIVVGNSVRGAMPVDTVVVNCLTGLA